ncbi:Legume lectin domain [Dillenia turbinata]|uniref:Legume lectin domain n=1 Tax=Dillenia turbinata TaxID=194707 RepID=A0AAN8UG89_9MAGN
MEASYAEVAFGPNDKSIIAMGSAYRAIDGLQVTPNERGEERTQKGGRATYVKPLHIWDNETATSTLGLTNYETLFNTTENQFVAVEDDIFPNHWDPKSYHVGINVNCMKFVAGGDMFEKSSIHSWELNSSLLQDENAEGPGSPMTETPSADGSKRRWPQMVGLSVLACALGEFEKGMGPRSHLRSNKLVQFLGAMRRENDCSSMSSCQMVA